MSAISICSRHAHIIFASLSNPCFCKHELAILLDSWSTLVWSDWVVISVLQCHFSLLRGILMFCCMLQIKGLLFVFPTVFNLYWLHERLSKMWLTDWLSCMLQTLGLNAGSRCGSVQHEETTIACSAVCLSHCVSCVMILWQAGVSTSFDPYCMSACHRLTTDHKAYKSGISGSAVRLFNCIPCVLFRLPCTWLTGWLTVFCLAGRLTAYFLIDCQTAQLTAWFTCCL